MTKREKHEIAVVVRAFMADECNEIRSAYFNAKGTLKGLRRYIHNECVSFWTDFDPYLSEKFKDIYWMKVGKRIINMDDCWCFIRDCLKEEVA